MCTLFALLLFLFSINTYAVDKLSEEKMPLSSPEEIATLSNDSSFLIKGLISPLSGNLSLRQRDLIVKGAEPLFLDRSYIPPQLPKTFHNGKEDWERYYLCSHLVDNYKGWQYFPHTRLQSTLKNSEIILNYPNGMTLAFNIANSNATLASKLYGITNVQGDIPSGKFDPRNTQISLENNRKRIVISSPEGIKRFYRSGSPIQDSSRMLCYAPLNPTSFFLEKEILENGKVIKYHYENAELKYVETLNPAETVVYASIRINLDRNSNSCQFLSSSGDTVIYEYEKRFYDVEAKSKEHGVKTTRSMTGAFPLLLTNVKSPFFKHEKINSTDNFSLSLWDNRSNPFSCKYGLFGSDKNCHYRLNNLLLPFGEKGDYKSVCTVDYQPVIPGKKEGTTTVKNSDGTKVVYSFTKDFLTKSITTYDQKGNLYHKKSYEWYKNQWLKSIQYSGNNSDLFYKKSYEYDSYGNPIKETIEGDLTGSESIEQYVFTRKYSQDRRNLLLQEETEEGKITLYEYLPNTNLITAKFTLDKEEILIREFYLYDENNNLIKKIIDDGKTKEINNLTGITERQLTYLHLKNEAPFLHTPKIIEEKYLENGEEKLFKKVILTRDKWGNIVREDRYDSEGNFSYSIVKEYNERGDLLSETNPLGQKAINKYNARGRCKLSRNFSTRLSETRDFDLRGNVLKEVHQGTDGESKEFSYIYDCNDILKIEKDEYGNVSKFFNDPCSKKPSNIHYPRILGSDQKATKVGFLGRAVKGLKVRVQKGYDGMGREIGKRDANRNITYYFYNARGSKTKTVYPDDSKEIFTYYRNGRLKEHINQAGLVIKYEYDVLGNITKKEYISKDYRAEEIQEYNSFHLISKTNKKGFKTTYKYDGLGRKIEEEYCGKKIFYEYDLLGRNISIVEENEHNTLVTQYEKDLLDRVCSEEKKDSQGNLLYKICYDYDLDGNRKEITRYINNKPTTELFSYDSFSRIVEHVDALGYKTTTSYNQVKNLLNQNVLRVTTIDPNFTETRLTYDSYQRLAQKEIVNSEDNVISFKEFYYDPCGNLSLEKDHVYIGVQPQSVQDTKYIFDSQNRLEVISRAFGSDKERSISHTYTLDGYIETKTLEDDTVLSYRYDPLGNILSVQSSDGSIDYGFKRNQNGELESAWNNFTNTKLTRKLDAFGNVFSETLPNGLTIEKTYDFFKRPTLITLPDQSSIQYIYDPLYLREVRRMSPSGDILYSHKYEKYDLDGNLQCEKVIGDNGNINYILDEKGRVTELSSPYYSQENLYNSCDKIISKSEDQKPLEYDYDELSQLISEESLDHKTSYKYDSIYNLLEKNDQAVCTNELNELLSFGETSYEYDLRGNLILKETPEQSFEYSYNAFNQLISVTSEGITTQYLYDPLGRRYSKTTNNETENYLWDGSKEIGSYLSDYCKNLKVLGKTALDPICIEINNKPYATFLDTHKNLRNLVDPIEATIFESYDYSAFGQELNSSNSSKNPWRYFGKRWDTESKTYYFGKRCYDPELAKWLSPDPLGSRDSTNLYQYVFNDPFSYADPEGEFVIAIPLLIWGAEIVIPTLYVVGYTAATAAVLYTGVKAVEAINDSALWKDAVEPPFLWDDLGDDPTVRPADGFEWKGKGKPSSGKGNWVRGKKPNLEHLNPDLDHLDPVGPHWDYHGPDFPKGIRLKPDGSWEHKIK